ncbi:MAG: Sua5/YciO/YrdC/YwlC family protein, partial [Candidatus Bathyarchaeota archaeon]
MEEPIARLRSDKHRKQKPFAIMSPEIETIRSFAEVNRYEEELLSSYRKPIILLNKNDDYYLSNLVSPELHTVGVMLPYTGLHTMLFDFINEPAFVMTSANPPNEPIVTKNDQAIAKLGSKVDYFLFHDRPIAQRCDDSVVRFHKNDQCLIRRSRGYAPEPIHLEFVSKRCILAVGGELNVTSCILMKNNAYISQHIGNVNNLENHVFHKDSIKHLKNLTKCKIDSVACDLHPRFTTTKLAQTIGKKTDIPVVMVQHHYAHAAALMAEYNVPEIVAITCDGFGYGSDGSAWGGEILYTYSGGFERVAHLEKQPMIGGDQATYYPLRLVTGILHKKQDMSEWLLSQSHHFPYGEKEVDLIIKQLEKGGIQKTT